MVGDMLLIQVQVLTINQMFGLESMTIITHH
jgi:hypothetical protein